MGLSSIIEHMSGQPRSHERKHHYKFQETLGAGAFGVVRKARNRDTGEEVAIKVILKSRLKDAAMQKDVMDEFEILGKLNHEHIVRQYEWFESKDKLYMVTQLCTGGELFDKIIEHGSFTEKDAARLMRDIADAVKYLHERNIVHRDIKPENLLFEKKRDDGSGSLVLCDFGVAKSLMSPEETIKSAAGSLGYAAPEVFGQQGYSFPVDVWSLGVVLYTMLSGVSPFQAETADDFVAEVQPGFKPYFYPQYWDQVSDAARSLVTRMLEYDPKKRITITEVCNDPWLRDAEANASIDLLPTVGPKLAARKRWRLAFEKFLLAKQLNKLQIREDSDDEDETEGAKRPAASAQSDLGARFMQVVAAAAAQAEAEDAAANKSGDGEKETKNA